MSDKTETRDPPTDEADDETRLIQFAHSAGDRAANRRPAAGGFGLGSRQWLGGSGQPRET